MLEGARDRTRPGRPGALLVRALAQACVCAGLIAATPGAAFPQAAPATRLQMLQAAERRVTTSADLRMLRLNARSRNSDTARAALRTLGQLERVSLVPDILLGLRHRLPEVRAAAAGALAQATQGVKGSTAKPTPGTATALASAQSALITRLPVETDATVRAAMCEALARLPYRLAAEAGRAESAILELAAGATTTPDRLGVAKALEVFVRVHGALRPPSPEVVAELARLVRADPTRPAAELLREARVRRLALESLITAGAVDDLLVERAALDADPQVRRLAMRAIAITGKGLRSMESGLVDPAPMVRLEALRALRTGGSEGVCEASLKAAADVDMTVALVAIDQLAVCGRSADAVAYLARTAGEAAAVPLIRGWHRHAHALVALATAAPDRAAAALAPSVSARIWQVRLYAARAASTMKDRTALDTLAADTDDRVANIALAGLGRPTRPATASPQLTAPAVTASDFRRLAAPRARVTIRDVGAFELLLLTDEAPGTVIRFATLAEAGYYNGLSFDRLAPNAIAQAGERQTGETATYSGRETGTWPHVRGSAGVLAAETGDAQFFINLVDNPRFDQRYPVFAQILNGADVVERMLEGDIIESIEILP